MANLKFADTHNMVAFLSKPEESDGFEQIVDFLNAHPIKYALTVNPTIYTSCIEQFWSTVKAKTINGEVQLHALVDGKKIIVTESTVRRDLQLEDAEGIDCLPNSTIFEELTRMGYEKISQKLTFYKAFFSPQWKFLIHTILQCLSSKTTAWNEFSSTMASVIICLATNQKFNFSKYIFESMVRNLDNLSGKFLMYPRFIQVFLNKQLEGRPTHKRSYDAPSHTKKIFGNMKRVGKGFSGRVTTLFPTMVVQNQAELGEDIVADEAVHKELGDSLVRAATTASSLEAEQDSGNITKTRSKETPNESSSLGTTSGGGPRCQETMGDTIAQTRFENVSKLSNDPLLAKGNTLQNGEDSLKLKELMELCTKLQTRVLDLEKTKTTQQNEIASLKRMVKKLKKKRSLISHGLKRLHKVGMSRRVESSGDEEYLGEDASKQGRRINAIDADDEITLVSVQDDADAEMFDVNTLTGDEVFAEQEVAAKGVNLTVDEVTLAQALAALKSVKPKVKGVVIQEPSTTTTTISSQQPSQAKVQDKGKGKMVEPEPVKPTKKKVQIMLDEEIALNYKQRLMKRKEFPKLKKKRLMKPILLGMTFKQNLITPRANKKTLAAKRAEEKRNKPPTKTKQKKTMITYLKNMECWKHKDLKSKDFDSIQKMFDRAFKRVNTFVDFRTDLVEGSSKRAGEELEQESTKKQKVDEDKDTAELQSLMEVIPDEEEVAIDVVPLATKPPTIVDWKIHKEGKKSYYQIVRADGKSQMYRVFSLMLKSFSREDLEDLYKLVKAKYKSTRPVEDLDLVLWSDLKTMFEPHVEDEIWKLQQRYQVLSWKLFDSCGVHCLSLQSGMIYMLVEKRYPLTPPTITDMLNKKLQGRIVGIKSLLNVVSITAALIDVNAAQSKLVLLENFNENYSKCLRLLYKVNAAEGVNAASEEVSTTKLVSTAYSAHDHVSLPPAISNVIGITQTMKIKSHSYYEYGIFESFTCWQLNPEEGGDDSVGSNTLDALADVQSPWLNRLVHAPSIATPFKPSKPKRTKSGVSSGYAGKSVADPLSDNNKRKRELIDVSTDNVSGNTPLDGSTDRAGSRSDKKKGRLSWYIDHSMAKKMDKRGSSNDPMVKPSLSMMLHKSLLIASKTIVGRDGIVHSYSGLKLSYIPATSSVMLRIPRTYVKDKGSALASRYAHTRASRRPRAVKPSKRVALTSASVPPVYHNLGPPSYQCSKYDATMWYAERTDKARRFAHPTFSMCCLKGKLRLPRFNDTPPPLKRLLDYTDPTTSKFREQIWVYKSMICFTSFGAKIDHSINSGKAPYTFGINGQKYHRMGSLLPAEGVPPRYGYVKNNKKTVKNEQAQTRESEEYKKKPKNQSRSQKSQASVRISQKSQENSQKRASTDTGIRRVQKEAKDSKPKPEKSSLSQIQSKSVKDGQ
ncbi:hypothetical protein Tco_1043890 [Tanacetum coccineum]|uniref:Uncharacterized protein n=1 Tax=Tanacetum coccineum TaxID=301880 RepID=A0ABQ5GND4_9ASTR